MMLRLLLMLMCLVLISANASDAAAATRTRFRGGSILASGYKLKEDQYTDTSVSSGGFSRSDGRLDIQYAIFTFKVFASPEEHKFNREKVIFSRRQEVSGQPKISTLVENRFGVRTFYISFPHGGPANFIVKVSADPELQAMQITASEAVVATFRPERPHSR
jgi:hypothetical protein